MSLFNSIQFLNELSGRCLILPFIVNVLTPKNAFSSILLILSGRYISLNDVHPSNANDPIDFKSFVLKVT